MLGVSSTKRASRVSTTSVHSARSPLATQAEIGRPLRSATAMILVALPRRVIPTSRPPFLRRHECRRYTPRSDRAFRADEGLRRCRRALDGACRSPPNVDSDDDTSSAVDTSAVGPPTARQFAGSRTRHSRCRVGRGTVAHPAGRGDCARPRGRRARLHSTARRSDPRQP